MDEGVTPIEDAKERAAVRRQARRVHLRAALVAIAVTSAALALG